jgi:Domain of unknown function (DUF4328)/Protein of unknown function (DUF2510)
VSDTPPAGWYPDPELPGYQRYWDGGGWTQYQTPPAGFAPAGPWSGGGQPAGGGYPTGAGYRSLKGLATALTVLLIVVAGLCLLVAVAHFHRAQVIDDFLAGRDLSVGQIDDADNGVMAVQGLTGAVVLGAAVVFIIWMHRAYRNAEAFGHHDLRLSAGWAIGAWFIPIYNWIGPKLILNDLWRVSDPELAPSDQRWRPRPVAGLVHLWWILLIVGGVLSRVRPFDNEATSIDDLETFRNLDRVTAVGFLILIPAAILGVVVVRRLTERFSARARRFGLVDQA